LNSTNIVIQHSVINNGDDCISFKPGSTAIVIQGLACTGSHGISVGSLGQYRGQTDIVENVYVGNISMSNASNGARIKTWAASGTMSGVGSGGGGSGRVQNVTYEGMRVNKVDWAIEITQCYGQKDVAACKAAPSKVSINNIYMSGFSGTTSGKHGNDVVSLTCSSSSNCRNIHLKEINIRSPSGGKSIKCSNISPTGVKCG
jgi:galacturan 1,4-alpha-galacturonidase